jgi:secreted trypsin-like serine protease
LNKEWILTAAHCTEGATATSLYVWKGLISRAKPSEGINTRVAEKVEHPNYSGNNNDFSLLRLRTAFDFTNVKYLHVAPACLPTMDEAPGTDALISGWGTLKSGGGQPTVLQKATPQIVSRTTCATAYSGRVTITSKMVCAAKSGVDTCQGDSGGPLVSQISGSWEIVGATSFGIGCADASFPGVYADVRSELSWIESIIGSGCPRT